MNRIGVRVKLRLYTCVINELYLDFNLEDIVENFVYLA